MAETPKIRLLGELEVLRGGRARPLPASKKTRALLGYLAVTRRTHSREELCDLLWQGPDDPRAALRWSLAKLRGVLGASAIVADRERVGLGAVETDLDFARLDAEGGASEATTGTLSLAVARFRGELLEGLGLPDCYRYHGWFTVEREAARALRIAFVTELEKRHGANPEEALRWARERVALDPLSEAAHARVVRLLADLGRRREALAQYETCRRILAEEMGAKPSPALVEARLYVAAARASSPPDASVTAPITVVHPAVAVAAKLDDGVAPLVGRRAELLAIDEALNAAFRREGGSVLLLQGDPGIGKSRLLREIGDRVRSIGGTVIAGRAFEAEMVRPYGPWLDGFRAVARARVPDAMRAALAGLLPELEGHGAAADRASQFDAVARLLTHLGSEGPVVVLLDDLQWFDEASAALLHYVARTVGAARVFLVGAVRAGELSDNAAALRLVRGLSREGLLQGLALGPLDREATAELLRDAAPGLNPDRVVEECGGNPLFAFELARAFARSADGAWDSLGDLIAERLSRLDGHTLELASWAAALGKSFDLETLERVTGTPPVDLLARIADLERHGIVRASVDGAGYDFAHDLVRAGAYRRLSAPSRRVVHRHIARALDAAPGPAVAGEVTHHAILGGDAPLAVRAALSAAQRCLRMFAGTEAARLAEAGLGQLTAFSSEERLPSELALLEVLVYSGTSARRPEELKGELTRTVMKAQDSGRHDMAAKGLHALSVLQFDGGDLEGAHESTLRAADAVEGVDPLERARQLAASARCLGMLERDMDQAQSMHAEAKALADAAGAELTELEWGGGVLCAFMGKTDDAAASFERALALARAAEDRWEEYECLRALVQLELESGRPTDRSDELLAVAAKMGGGSELPSARSLAALDRLVRGDPDADESIESALSTLRGVDAKGMLAYVLTFAGDRDVQAGRVDAGERRANEALRAAAVVNRQSQAALARVVLVRAALARGDVRAAERHRDAVRPALDRPFALSARARAAVIGVM